MILHFPIFSRTDRWQEVTFTYPQLQTIGQKIAYRDSLYSHLLLWQSQPYLPGHLQELILIEFCVFNHQTFLLVFPVF